MSMEHRAQTPLLTVAFELAEELHREQTRKGRGVPYVSHLLGVAALVLEDGGSEAAAAGALLHDAAEDQGGEATLSLIEQRCGRAVAQIVRECSDAIVAERSTKAPWKERKQEFIDQLKKKSDDSLLVIAADKLHNLQATLIDLQVTGPGVWSRFKTGEEGFHWYHREMLAELDRLIPTSRSVAALHLIMDQFQQSAR